MTPEKKRSPTIFPKKIQSFLDTLLGVRIIFEEFSRESVICNIRIGTFWKLEDSGQSQEEFAKSLGVTRQATTTRFRALEMIKRQGNWVPHEF